jgi:hypothetical protein
MDRIVTKYWGRALASRYLYAWVPYLRYVGFNGSLVRGNASVSSDIDLMVVAEPGHIFTVRFFMVGIIALIGIKRTGRRIAGRLCANYFITTDDLDIKPHNRRVAQAYRHMVAMIDDCHCEPQRGRGNLDRNDTDCFVASAPRNDTRRYHNEIMQQNKWMRKYRVPISPEQTRLNVSIKPVGEPWQTIRLVLEMILFPVADTLENILKYFQIVKIMRHPLTGIDSSNIIVNDSELRFHPRKHG